ncbi:MAG TPA: 16S rRNA (uracil(1498)-N(3))-methyltransferase [Pseudomonadales bacterium]|nr:16S rRNA (uracil(1498)-N(3))-methyltransferase [Pseudomonadales bacterium]
MRRTRLHLHEPLTEGEHAVDADAAHYLLRVLRHRVGDALVVFDGTGLCADAELVDADPRRCRVRVGAPREDHTESPLSVHLGLALLRGERMDIALQKACELGVARVSLLETERVELRLDAKRLGKRMQHWQGVLRHAAQQSGRSRIPELVPPAALAAFAGSLDEGHARLVMDPEGSSLGAAPESAAAVLVTGPEGGLADAELTMLADHGFQRVAFGPRVLRAETAPLVGLAVLQWCWGDLAG